MSLSPSQIAALLGANSGADASAGRRIPTPISPESAQAARPAGTDEPLMDSCESYTPSPQKPQPRHTRPRESGRLIERAEQSKPRRVGNALIKHPEIAQAPQIELAVLAALYLHPEHCFPIFNERAKPDFFFNPVYRTFYDLISDYFAEHLHIDISAFVQHISDLGQFEKIGGPPFLADLLHCTSPVTAFTYHLDILRDKYVAREVSRLASTLASKIQSATEEEMWTVMSEHDRAMSDLRALATDQLEGVENFSYSDLIEFDASKDESVLIGAHRWLGRGYTCLWAGGSGYGKSTLEMQAALYWATGTPLFGIKPVRPLKSLIIQAENDLGDTGEQFQGVIAGIKATGDVELNGQVERMIVVNRLIGCTGDNFLCRLRSLLKIHTPDLVWIDPLFAFAGCDLIDTESVSRFLREGLIPIAVEHNVCAHVIHHVSKPARDNDSKSDWSDFEYQYLGFGSSEIQNAFRAVNILLPVSGHDGVFRLSLSKRGARAGAKDIDGEPTTSLFLAHSKEGKILWSQVEKPPDQSKSKRGTFEAKFTVEDIIGEMSMVNGLSAGELQKILASEFGMSRPTFYRLFGELKESGKIQIGDGRTWTKSSIK